MKKGIITIGLSALICFASVLVYIKNGFANEKKEVEVAVLHTQETGFTDSGESLYTEIGEYGKNGLAKVKKDGKYGLINELGVVLAQTVYDEMGEFGTNGLILVRQGRRYNFLNSFGMCEFETVGEFSEGGVAPAKRDGKYYFIDKRGNRVNDRTYDSVFVMDKGKMYKVRCGIKYGAVNGKGEEVIPAVYDGMYPTTYEGGIGIMPKLLRVEVWKDVYAYIIWNGTSYGAADENGKLLCDVKYKNIIGINKENQIIIVENEDGIREWRNLDNELVRELGENGWLSYGVIIISEEGKPTTYYNTSLNSVIEHEYEWSREYDDFFIFEQENGKYGVMDYEKNIIAEPIYDILEYVTDEEYFIVTYNGKKGYYTKDMQEIIPCQFDHAEFFRDNGLALVEIDGRKFLINKNGQIVIPPIYDDISMGLGYEYIEVKKGEKWGAYK